MLTDTVKFYGHLILRCRVLFMGKKLGGSECSLPLKWLATKQILNAIFGFHKNESFLQISLT